MCFQNLLHNTTHFRSHTQLAQVPWSPMNTRSSTPAKASSSSTRASVASPPTPLPQAPDDDDNSPVAVVGEVVAARTSFAEEGTSDGKGGDDNDRAVAEDAPPIEPRWRKSARAIAAAIRRSKGESVTPCHGVFEQHSAGPDTTQVNAVLGRVERLVLTLTENAKHLSVNHPRVVLDQFFDAWGERMQALVDGVSATMEAQDEALSELVTEAEVRMSTKGELVDLVRRGHEDARDIRDACLTLLNRLGESYEHQLTAVEASTKTGEILAEAEAVCLEVVKLLRSPSSMKALLGPAVDNTRDEKLHTLLDRELEARLGLSRRNSEMTELLNQAQLRLSSADRRVIELETKLARAYADNAMLRDSRVFEILSNATLTEEAINQLRAKRPLDASDSLSSPKRPRLESLPAQDPALLVSKSPSKGGDGQRVSNPDPLAEEEARDLRKAKLASMSLTSPSSGGRRSGRNNPSSKALDAQVPKASELSKIIEIDSDSSVRQPRKPKAKRAIDVSSDGEDDESNDDAASADSGAADESSDNGEDAEGSELSASDSDSIVSGFADDESPRNVPKPSKAKKEKTTKSKRSTKSSSSSKMLASRTPGGGIIDCWTCNAPSKLVDLIENVLDRFRPTKKIGTTYALGRFNPDVLREFLRLDRNWKVAMKDGQQVFCRYVLRLQKKLPAPTSFDLNAMAARASSDPDVNQFVTAFEALRSPELLLAAWEAMHFIPFSKQNSVVEGGVKITDCNQVLDGYVNERGRRSDRLRKTWTRYVEAAGVLAARGDITYRAIVDPSLPIHCGSFVWTPRSKQRATVGGLRDSVEALDRNERFRVWFIDTPFEHPYVEWSKK